MIHKFTMTYLFNKIKAPNTVYKLWLGQSSLGKSCGFSKASFYQERSVPRFATAHIPNVSIYMLKNTQFHKDKSLINK